MAWRWGAGGGREVEVRYDEAPAGALPPLAAPGSKPRWSFARSRVTSTTLPPTGWSLLKIPPMKQAADPDPFPFERSPMRIVLLFVRKWVSVGLFGTNEVADVSVIEASHHVWSCPCTHGCVLTAINVIEERRSANCRVVVGKTASAEVIILERDITNGGVCSAMLIFEKRRITKRVVAEAGRGWLNCAETPKAPLKSAPGLPTSPLKKSASTPTAVFRVPVALNNIAAAPTAVFSAARFYDPAMRSQQRCCMSQSRRRTAPDGQLLCFQHR